jgi:hypothetical protein
MVTFPPRRQRLYRRWIATTSIHWVTWSGRTNTTQRPAPWRIILIRSPTPHLHSPPLAHQPRLTTQPMPPSSTQTLAMVLLSTASQPSPPSQPQPSTMDRYHLTCGALCLRDRLRHQPKPRSDTYRSGNVMKRFRLRHRGGSFLHLHIPAQEYPMISTL